MVRTTASRLRDPPHLLFTLHCCTLGTVHTAPYAYLAARTCSTCTLPPAPRRDAACRCAFLSFLYHYAYSIYLPRCLQRLLPALYLNNSARARRTPAALRLRYAPCAYTCLRRRCILLARCRRAAVRSFFRSCCGRYRYLPTNSAGAFDCSRLRIPLPVAGIYCRLRYRCCRRDMEITVDG